LDLTKSVCGGGIREVFSRGAMALGLGTVPRQDRSISKGIILEGLLFKTFFFIAFFLLIPVPANGTTYVVFRYDDFAADKPGIRETNTMRMGIWEAEKAVDKLFNKYCIPYAIAVIPKLNDTSLAEDAEKIEFIRQAVIAERVEVAQHGLSHTNYAKAKHRRGEFCERDYKSQLESIRQGREILCKSLNLPSIKTFVPPFNGWDKNTVKALKHCGFSVISADRYYWHDAVEGLTVIPFTAQLWELESMVDEKRLPDDGIIVVLYHPPQIVEFKGKEHRFFGIERFERLLQKLETVPYVKFVTLQQLARKRGSLTIDRYRAANALWRQRSFWSKLLPQDLWPGESSRLTYLAADVYARQVTYWRMLTVALTSGLLFAGLVVRYLIKRVLSAKWHIRVDVIASLIFFSSVLKEIQIIHKGYHITGISAIPAIFTASFVAALVLRAIRAIHKSTVLIRPRWKIL